MPLAAPKAEACTMRARRKPEVELARHRVTITLMHRLAPVMESVLAELA